MAQDTVQICLNNANQTEIESPGYVHRVNPLNVTHIYTLTY